MKKISVEINGVFYESLRHVSRAIGCNYMTVKKRCLSDDFLNYKFVPFRITYTEKRCKTCGKIKPLNEFHVQATTRDGLRCHCKQCRAERKKEWNQDNSEHKREYNKEYSNTHKKERNIYEKERRKTDPAYKVNVSMSRAISVSLKNGKGGKHWEGLVDYDLGKLMIHLESKFTEGMNWDNYGWGDDKWNIDHEIAKCHFNITSADCQAFKDCWSLKNLQPLWQVRNFEKGNKPMHPKYLIKPF